MLHLKISVFLAVVSLASAWPMVIDAFDAGHCSGKALVSLLLVPPELAR